MKPQRMRVKKMKQEKRNKKRTNKAKGFTCS